MYICVPGVGACIARVTEHIHTTYLCNSHSICVATVWYLLCMCAICVLWWYMSSCYRCNTGLCTCYQECKTHGRLAGDAAAHKSNIADRDKFVRDTALQIGANLHGAAAVGTDPLPPSTIEAFQSDLRGKLTTIETSLQHMKAANRCCCCHSSLGP